MPCTQLGNTQSPGGRVPNHYVFVYVRFMLSVDKKKIKKLNQELILYKGLPSDSEILYVSALLKEMLPKSPLGKMSYTFSERY